MWFLVGRLVHVKALRWVIICGSHVFCYTVLQKTLVLLFPLIQNRFLETGMVLEHTATTALKLCAKKAESSKLSVVHFVDDNFGNLYISIILLDWKLCVDGATRTNTPEVCQRVNFKVATLVHRLLSGKFSASYLADDCHLVADARERWLCSTESRTCVVTWTHTNIGDRAFAAAGLRLWNRPVSRRIWPPPPKKRLSRKSTKKILPPKMRKFGGICDRLTKLFII